MDTNKLAELSLLARRLEVKVAELETLVQVLGTEVGELTLKVNKITREGGGRETTPG